MSELLEYLIQVRGGREAAAQVGAVKKEVAGLGEATTATNVEQDASAVRSEKAAKGFSGMEKSASALRGTMLLVGGALGLGALKVGVGDIVKSGTAWQEQTAAMSQALKNTHTQSKGLTDHLSTHAETLSTQGGFAAPDQIQSLTQFITQTGNVTKAVQLNTAAMNLARGAHLGYAQATRLVQTAEAGTPGRLARIIGPIITVTKYTQGWTSAQKLANPVGYEHAKMLDKQATATEIVGRIQQKLGGQMAAFSHTAAGAMSNAKNAIDNAGRAVSVALLPYIAKLATWLAKNLPAAIQWTINATKNVIGWFNRHKTTAIVLRDTLILLGTTIGTVFAVSRVLRFGQSFLSAAGNIKAAIRTILIRMGLIGAAADLEATAVVGADAEMVTANTAVGLSFSAMIPLIGAVALAVEAIPKLQAPSLPGGPAHVTGHGTAAQRRALTKAAKSVGITVPPISGNARTSASGTGIVHSGIVHNGDIVIQVAGKEFARLTKRQIQQAMMAGA